MFAAGIAASSQRRTTSKGTKVSNLYEYFKYISLTIPEIFGFALVFDYVDGYCVEYFR